MRRKRSLLIWGMTATVILSGCQKNPDSSIVKNKDLDRMIEEAGNTENGSSSVADLAGEYDTYQATIRDDSQHVDVDVDARVDIPSADKMSVIRIGQKKIDQSLLDKIKEELIPGEKLYDGAVLRTRTRSSIEEEIQMWRREIADLENGGYSSEDVQTMREEYQGMIDSLQEEYESAPVDVPLQEHPSDGLLHSVKELYEGDSQDGFYAWEYELNPDGDIYYGVTDGRNGAYSSLYVQNNEDYGNCLRFACNRHGAVNLSSVAVDGRTYLGRWKADAPFSKEDMIMEIGGEDELEEYTDMPVTITADQARSQAEELLEHLGLTSFELFENELYCEIPDIQQNQNGNGKVGYHRVYVLKYLRKIDGVFVNNEGDSKFTDGWDGDDYVKKEWGGESIEIKVNDDGIVGFYYNFPLEIIETVADQASMKGFDEIKDIFEQMVVVANAQEGAEEDERVHISVDEVVLRYTRISEADSFDTGLLVPVWDFMGSITDSYGEKDIRKSQNCVLTVNAIDGTVIDRRLGY